MRQYNRYYNSCNNFTYLKHNLLFLFGLNFIQIHFTLKKLNEKRLGIINMPVKSVEENYVVSSKYKPTNLMVIFGSLT